MNTTKNISTFTFPVTNNTIRTLIDENGDPWFVAKDVCAALQIGWDKTNRCYAPSRMVRYLNEDEKGSSLIATPSGLQRTLIISESGLYKLVMRSDKPEAKKFQDWVTKDVLPAIRKDGGYILGEEKVKTGEMSEDELLLKAMTILTNKVQRLTAERDALQSKVTEHLDYLTVDEWRALNHLYLTHGEKIRLGLCAKKLAAEKGIAVIKQARRITVVSRTTGNFEYRDTSVNVFPADILNTAAIEVGLIAKVA